MTVTERVVAHDAGFSTPQLCAIVGITERQADYWARTDLLRPSLAEARGSGSRRRWSYDDLLVACCIVRLLDAGLFMQQVRCFAGQLRHLDERHEFVVSIGNAVLTLTDAALLALINARCRLTLTVLSLRTIAAALDQALARQATP